MHALFLIFTLIIFFSFLGLTQIMKEWRILVSHQLRIDECVATTAIKFENSLNKIQKINFEMNRIRKVATVSALSPKLRLAIKTALKIQSFRLKKIIWDWKAKQLLWLLTEAAISHPTFLFHSAHSLGRLNHQTLSAQNP